MDVIRFLGKGARRFEVTSPRYKFESSMVPAVTANIKHFIPVSFCRFPNPFAECSRTMERRSQSAPTDRIFLTLIKVSKPN